MRRYKNKIIIVTGAASGIGEGIAKDFGSEGAIVCCLDIDSNGLRNVVQNIVDNSGRADSFAVDVSDSYAINQTLTEIVNKYGTVDVLVNNAGINMAKKILDLDERDWDNTMDINLKSMFLLSKSVWPIFKEKGRGVIINMASVMGQVGGVGAPAYCASKSAIIMLTKCLAKDGAPLGIRVNAVCPGYIDTPIMEKLLSQRPDPQSAKQAIIDMQPMKRMGTPSDIAKGVLFLASDDASYINGTDLTIDGAVTSTQID